jgi:tellurite resistance protein TehA-like permease
MATGIVSGGLALDDEPALSNALLGLGIALWLGLAAVFLARLVWQRRRWLEEARSPASLTAAAGTAVLGSRLTLVGADWAGYILFACAFCVWVWLLHPVLANWLTPTVGVSFLLCVATESLAVLAAVLGVQRHLPWLAGAALVLLVLGLIAYLYALRRIDLRQLLVGRGDHWIFGGALAIATLASARTTEALERTSTLVSLHGTLTQATIVLWVAAVCWLPFMLAGEVIVRRPGYESRRWSTVFPVGMYAVCSAAAGSVSGIAGLESFAHVWIWIALALWAVVFAAMLRHGLQLLRLTG